jgi:two-component system sensor histidine kinase TctE
LLDLKEAVEHRLPQDLSAIDLEASPEEVRPLVQSLNRLFERVNAQAESQRRFVADAAHQLRTPLAGLQAQVEAWAQAVNNPAAAAAWREKYEAKLPLAVDSIGPSAILIGSEKINHLRDAVRRTSQLANQLLALSRADARSMDAQPLRRVDLKDLCETLLEVYLDAAQAKQIDLGLDVQAVHVDGQDWLLRELICNLLDNALKYTPDGGTVTLRCAPATAQRGPWLEVEDNGPGVPPAQRLRVLERFYRVPGTAAEGNGLGLAIANEIARVHRSELVISSGAGGQGTRVTLVFAV